MSNRNRLLLAGMSVVLVSVVTVLTWGRQFVTKEASGVDRRSIPSPGPSAREDSREEYETDVFDAESMQEQNRAARRQGDWFKGRVNGIYIDQHYQPICATWVQMSAADLRRYRLPAPRQLPPEAEVGAPKGWLCGKRPLGIDRVIKFWGGAISMGVSRQYGSTTLRARAGETRVRNGTIQGRPAVFVLPLTSRGAGNSYIAFEDRGDLIVFTGVDIRFADLRAAAESFPL